MFRLFLLFVLLAVSLYAVRLWRSGRIANSTRSLKRTSNSKKMVPCEKCGLHIPEHEAIRIGDSNFCSLEHAKPPG